METMTIDQERKERFLLDKHNTQRENLRRSVEVSAHAIKLARGVDNNLDKKLIGLCSDAIDKLKKTLA